MEDTEKTKYIIELERQATKSFIHKFCFNASSLVVEQLGPAADHLDNNKSIPYVFAVFFFGK